MKFYLKKGIIENNMVGEQPPQGGQIGKSEGKSPQDLEILDAEKLGKYGALYGRFLLASQAQPEEVTGIIDPDKPVEFNLTTAALKKRDYNPISANLSFKERQEEWKEAPSFDAAYSQWRTKFTGFMTQITDPKREFILGMIMHGSKKAADFNESDADRLFNDFCKGKSDVTAFIDRVTASLANPDGDGKINPITIQTVLPHIEWIASGLFGKKTASTVVIRLIELESALRNNPEQVIGIFNSDKQRTKNLTDDEKKVLGSLYSLVPQASKTVTSEPTPKPTPATTSEEPKPDEEEPPTVSVQPPEADLTAELAKWKRLLAAARTIPNITIAWAKVQELEEQISAAAQTQPPAPPIVSAPEQGPTIESLKARTGDLEKKQEEIAELLKRQLPTGAETEPHQPVIEEVPIGGRAGLIRLKVNGKDLGFEFQNMVGDGYYFFFPSLADKQEYLDIPEGINVGFDTEGEGTVVERIIIIGGENTRLNLKDLISLGIYVNAVDVFPPEYKGFGSGTIATAGHEGQAARYYYSYLHQGYNYEKQIGKWMSMEELENYLKTRKEEIERNKIAGEKAAALAGPKPEETATEENIIDVEHINIDNLPEEFNKLLSQNKDRSHIVFSFSPLQLKAYMASIAKGMQIEGGSMEIGKDNKIEIRDLRITKAGIGITLSLAINNYNDRNGLAGIDAKITKFKRDLFARAIPASSREEVEKQIEKFEDLVWDELYNHVTQDNSAWKKGNISISDGKFLIRFEKRPQEV